MKQEVLSLFPSTHLTLIALLIFIIFFVGLLIWVFRKSAKKRYQKMAKLPLSQSDSNGERDE